LKLIGSANHIADTRVLLGEFTASHEHPAVLQSVVWSAMGHGDVVFVLRIDFDPATGTVTPHEYHDHWVARQKLGEDLSPIEALTIPSGGTARFMARADSGADSAGFLAVLELED